MIDPVFGPVATAAAAALGPGGRLVNIGGTAGDSAEFSSAVLRGRSIAILGYTNNALSPTQRADALRSVLAAMEQSPSSYGLSASRPASAIALGHGALEPRPRRPGVLAPRVGGNGPSP